VRKERKQEELSLFHPYLYLGASFRPTPSHTAIITPQRSSQPIRVPLLTVVFSLGFDRFFYHLFSDFLSQTCYYDSSHLFAF
jgi:hypothetical protein